MNNYWLDGIYILLISIGVAMDAFAVSIERGINIDKIKLKQALLIASTFGLFQMIMPLIGIFSGEIFYRQIEKFDHWLALIILVFIGTKMIKESFSHEDKSQVHNLFSLFCLALATSIDSLAVGLSLIATKLPILITIISMGVVTFTFSLIGVLIGKNLTNSFGKRAEFFGGIILVLIGLKIFSDHMFLKVPFGGDS